MRGICLYFLSAISFGHIVVKFKKAVEGTHFELLNCLYVCMYDALTACGEYRNGSSAICSARVVVEGECLSLFKVCSVNIPLLFQACIVHLI